MTLQTTSPLMKFWLFILFGLLATSIYANVMDDDDSEEEGELEIGSRPLTRLLGCDATGGIHLVDLKTGTFKPLNSRSNVVNRVFDDHFFQTSRENGVACNGLFFDKDAGATYMTFPANTVPNSPNGGAYLIDADLGTRASRVYRSFQFPLEAVSSGPDGLLYGAGGNTLYKVDIQTGLQTAIATLAPAGGQNAQLEDVIDLAYYDGAWYLLSSKDGESVIWLVNAKNGQLTVGATWPERLSSLTTGPNGFYAGAGQGDNANDGIARLYSVSKNENGQWAFKTIGSGLWGVFGLTWAPAQQVPADWHKLPKVPKGHSGIVRCKAGLRATDRLDEIEPTGFVELHVDRKSKRVKVAAAWDEDALAGASSSAGIVGPQRLNNAYDANNILLMSVTLPSRSSTVWSDTDLTYLLNGWTSFVVRSEDNPIAEISGTIKCDWI